MNIKKRDIVLIVAAVIYLLALLTVIKACDAKEDGTWMHCHTAWQTVLGLGACMLGAALVRLCCRGNMLRMGLDTLLMLLAVAAMLVPGTFVRLCMMPAMRCRAVMRPGVLVLSILMLAVSAVTLALDRRDAYGRI